MAHELGKFIQQPTGYKAFIPHPFPPQKKIEIPTKTQQLHSTAMRNIGKLDGITQLLPDLDFFLFMYIRKEAALSSQIEGTQATMVDAISAESIPNTLLPNDVDDILHYVNALNYGIKRLKKFPLSLRLIREVHKILMSKGRSTHFANPGEFRKSQNWIGGASPNTASFIPPPVHELGRALSDLEKFLHATDDFLPLVKTSLLHAQFETIHPFLDGNGRTGRLLITFYLCQQQFLEQPVLYLSSFFKQHQQTYYDLLQGYHHGHIIPWVDFMLEGISSVAEEAITVSKKITILREQDREKMQTLGKTTAPVSVHVLRKLYQLPVVNNTTIQEWTGYTRVGAQKMIDRFIQLDILHPQDAKADYGRKYIYKKYLNIFEK